MRSNTIRTTLKLGALVALTLAAVAITFTIISRGDEPKTAYAGGDPFMDISIGTCTTDAGTGAHRELKCQVVAGDQFDLAIDLNELYDPPGSYTGFQTFLTFPSAAVAHQEPAVVHPQCASSQVDDLTPGELTVTCDSMEGGASTYIGDLVSVPMSCTDDGWIRLITQIDPFDPNGTYPTHLLDKSSGEVRVSGGGLKFMQIFLTCVPPPPDSDSDGCPDAAELGPDPAQGGQRDPANFWDFLDVWTGSPPQRDGTVSVGDVLAVVQRFGASVDPPPSEQDALAEALTSPPPAPAYHPSYDRGGTYEPNNPWNLLPPDGAISVGDIIAVVNQFGHSCA